MSKEKTSRRKQAIKSKPLLSAVPIRMKKARESYGLGFSNMSCILGLGANQWMLYEKGKAQPNASNSNLIEIALRPRGMLKLLEICSPVAREKLGKKWRKSYDKVEAMVIDIDRRGEDLKSQIDSTYFD